MSTYGEELPGVDAVAQIVDLFQECKPSFSIAENPLFLAGHMTFEHTGHICQLPWKIDMAM